MIPWEKIPVHFSLGAIVHSKKITTYRIRHTALDEFIKAGLSGSAVILGGLLRGGNITAQAIIFDHAFYAIYSGKGRACPKQRSLEYKTPHGPSGCGQIAHVAAPNNPAVIINPLTGPDWVLTLMVMVFSIPIFVLVVL